MKALFLTPGGAAELRVGTRTLWNSADDETFRSEFTDDMLDDTDLDDVLEFLVEHDHLTEHEADNIEIHQETLDGDTIDVEDDEDDEDDYDTGYN